jgi:phosphoglycerate dehydrogenase-like enzyme
MTTQTPELAGRRAGVAPRRPVELVHVFHPSAARALDRFADLLGNRRVRVLPDERAFAEALPEIEVLFAINPPRVQWETASRLRLVQLGSVGADHLLPAPGLPESVEIANSGGATSGPMAEYVVGQLLFLVKRFAVAEENQRRRRWTTHAPGVLAGRRVTVLGYGPVGRRVCALLAPFSVELSVVVRRPRPLDGVSRVYGADDLLDVLRETDDLVLTLPLTAATRGIVGAAELGALPRHAHVVNVSRGGLVDERALVAALQAGELAGAALDTVDEEPLGHDDPLWDCPGLFLGGHSSWTTPHRDEEIVRILMKNLNRLESGQPLLNLVDREHGYPVVPPPLPAGADRGGAQ